MPKKLKSNILANTKQITQIPLDQIRFENSQEQNIRRKIHQDSIAQLAQSIELHGLQNPIQIYPTETAPNTSQQYLIISGHRRYQAHKFLLEKQQKPLFNTIEAIICSAPEKLHYLTAAQLAENIQREDLSPADLERALKIYMAETKIKPEQAAQQLGKSQQWVYKYLQAADAREKIGQILPQEEQGILDQIGTTTMQIVAGAKTEEEHTELYQAAKEGKTNVEIRQIRNQQKISDQKDKSTKPQKTKKEVLYLNSPCTPQEIINQLDKLLSWSQKIVHSKNPTHPNENLKTIIEIWLAASNEPEKYSPIQLGLKNNQIIICSK